MHASWWNDPMEETEIASSTLLYNCGKLTTSEVVVDRDGCIPLLSYARMVTLYLVPLRPVKTPDVVTTPESLFTRKGTWGVMNSNQTTWPLPMSASVTCSVLRQGKAYSPLKVCCLRWTSHSFTHHYCGNNSPKLGLLCHRTCEGSGDKLWGVVVHILYRHCNWSGGCICMRTIQYVSYRVETNINATLCNGFSKISNSLAWHEREELIYRGLGWR